ncbi:hypothetical protein SAMN04489761_2157 [Tenacibaculum sp. MAR_2009_124]|uniref:hypothetical protein n=1 Tax=Tenacibaculum sp. MAR_2009_124 TaxID=1250059 RepID=UPI0008978683|nr:hypothetical protein [Tenacibaculum sp. MAR_2009_124]SEB98145.1 hypothetical protein SAMN04489761_2157 [Tenacibaculum sp. MAR_2009_124]
MKKSLATLALLGAILTGKAQKIENKIPSNSSVVVAGNADNVFKLINFSEINSSALGKEILKDINRKREDNNQVNSLDNVGIDLKSNAYYFFKQTDSISYHNIMVELKDRKQFESTLKESKREDIERKNGYNILQGYSNLTIWNDEMLFLVNGDRSYSYFNEHKERLEKQKKEGEASYKFKRRVANGWARDYAENIFQGNISNNLSSNSSFQKSKKKNSVVTLWLPSYGSLMGNFMKSYKKLLSNNLINLNDSNIYGVNEVSANLFFDKDNASISLDMEVNPDMKKYMKKIYNKRLDKKLINGFDHEKALAFWSMSINTEEMLLQYPDMLTKMYGGIIPSFKNEIDIVGDLLSILIDEEAVGDLITGDALFVLNDFGKKEVSYKSYKYDENYERKEVTKTKETVVPDFTLMIGSKEQGVWKKALKIGEKYKVLRANNNVYEFIEKTKDLPFEIYAVVKNDILYITTSKLGAVSFAVGRSLGKSNKYGKLIRNNTSVLYADVNALLDKFPKEYVGRSEKKMLNFSKENLKDAVLRVSRIKGSTISSELKLNTRGIEENTLKLLFEFINQVAK